MKLYAGRESTRVKDLADLVIIAQSQTADLTEVRSALRERLTAARMTDELEYRVPTSWSDRFQEIRDDTPALARVKGFDEALSIAKPSSTELSLLRNLTTRRGHRVRDGL